MVLWCDIHSGSRCVLVNPGGQQERCRFRTRNEEWKGAKEARQERTASNGCHYLVHVISCGVGVCSLWRRWYFITWRMYCVGKFLIVTSYGLIPCSD